MRTYDSLLESDPGIQKMRVEDELKGMVRSLLIIVETRFPTLLEMARQLVTQLNSSDDLNRIIKLVVLAPDEKTARFVLESFAA